MISPLYLVQVVVKYVVKTQKISTLYFYKMLISIWLRGIDSNYRPSGYEPDELPTAPPRDLLFAYLV